MNAADAWAVTPAGCPTCGADGFGPAAHLPECPSLSQRARPVRYTPADACVTEAEDLYPRLVAEELVRQRARRDARNLLQAQERAEPAVPPFKTLRDWMAEPDEPTTWRVDSMLPMHGRVVLAAQFKAGKTTLIGNLVRSLVDGDAFLGRFSCVPILGRVGLIDVEMSRHTLKSWLRDQRIDRADRVVPLPLRGTAASFDLLNDAVRGEWAAALRANEISFLVVDCLRPILDALALDENKDAGRFLVSLDALCNEAGISEAVLVHHMGHNGDRSRGDSRIRDWPDVEWRLVRQDANPNSPRFISAFGRDVDFTESQLAFDTSTRRLSIVGGAACGARPLSRQEMKHFDVLRAIFDTLDDFARRGEKPSGRKIVEAFASVGSEIKRDAIWAALKFGLGAGYLDAEDGPRGSKLYAKGRHSVDVKTGACHARSA